MKNRKYTDNESDVIVKDIDEDIEDEDIAENVNNIDLPIKERNNKYIDFFNRFNILKK